MDIEGVYTPVVTPFGADGEIDFERYREVIEAQLAGGVRGIIPAGTTGEYYAVSEAERLRLFQSAAEIVGERAQLVAGANAGGTRDVIRYGLAARELGYDGLLLAAPATSLPQQSELAAHYRAVAEEVGLPIILYNYPARAGVEIGLEALDELADIPEIVAIKESSGDFSRFLALQQLLEGRVKVSCGSDDQALDYFFWGVDSWIAGTANVLPAEHVELLRLSRAGSFDEAKRIWAALLPWIQNMESGRYNQKAKLGIETLQGIAVGSVRQPLLPLDDDAAAAYLAVLAAATDGVRRESSAAAD